MKVQRYNALKCSDMIKIHNGIMFIFYPGLLHMYLGAVATTQLI